MKKSFVCGVLFIGQLFSGSSHAFKVDTHVWIGQQIINDLEDDGKLSFRLAGKPVDIAPSNETRSAILNNKSAFLMGNIGPDAVPDAVAGQMIVHPGLKNGWKTNNWLEYLLAKSTNNDAGRAFTFGYLGHAAADVFAHTYVNQYAGGVFDTKDEMLVEQRHMILEGYIAKYTPPMKDSRNNPLGERWKQIQLSDKYAAFVRDALIYDPEVIHQYRASRTTLHLAAYGEFRKQLDNLAEDKVWHEIDKLVLQIIAYYFDINLSSDEASQIINIAQPIIDHLNVDVPDNLQELDSKLLSKVKKFESRGFTKLDDAVARMSRLETSLLNKQRELDTVIAKLATTSLPACTNIIVPRLNCRWKKKKWRPPVYSCDTSFTTEPDPVCDATRRQITRDIQALTDLKHKLDRELIGTRSDFVATVKDVRDTAINIAYAIDTIKNAAIDLAQYSTADVSPVQSALRAWRADVDEATLAYVKATSQGIINTMNPTASPFEPIETWFNCHHLSIIGINSSVSSCQTRQALSDIKGALTSIQTIIDVHLVTTGTPAPPGYNELKDLRLRLIDTLVSQLRLAASDKLESFLPHEVREIISLFDKEVDDATLNYYFTKPETVKDKKGLIPIPDMASRVKSEMRITNGSFSLDAYAVTYNAVVLAKLALLDNSGLNQLAGQAGITVDSNGNKPFNNINNIVAGAFANIDANHQWMPISPSPPNTIGAPYSCGRYASPTGFLLWSDWSMRGALFRSLFIGPVSSGIDDPASIGHSVLVRSDYPYRPSMAYPYPDDPGRCN